MGKRARARISELYDINGIAERYAAIYRGLAPQGAG
jgi:hypothetical protein